MKTKHLLPLALLAALLAGGRLHAQIFVTNYFGNTITEYNSSGGVVANPLVSGDEVNSPCGIAISGSDMFVVNEFGDTYGTITEYTTSGSFVGTLVSGSASGLRGPQGIAISGSDIFVTDYGGANLILEYTTSGARVGSGTLVSSGLDGPSAIAISGSDIFVANINGGGTNGWIGEYTTAGAPVGTGTLISGNGLAVPQGIAISGSDIFVANEYNNTITEYTTAGAPVGTGTLVSGNGLAYPNGIVVTGSDILVTNTGTSNTYLDSTITEYTLSGSFIGTLVSGDGLDYAYGIAVIPEPSTWALLAIGGAGLLVFALRRRGQSLIDQKSLVPG